MNKFGRIAAFAAMATAAGGLLHVLAADLGYKDTPMLPGNIWHVHDSDRPHPPIVTPGTASTQEVPGKAPSDADVLFDGTNLDKWQSDNGGPSKWKLENGYMEVRGGTNTTREKFGDCQLHVEFMEPPPKGDSQGRGNSGVFMMGQYEIQVLDNYNNPTYSDGQTGAIYGQFPPLVNPDRPPGEWETYDIIWEAPHFDGQKVVKPAIATILLNGVVVQNHTELIGATGHRILGKYHPHPDMMPIALQDHGNPVRYRNIWVRPLHVRDEGATPPAAPKL